MSKVRTRYAPSPTGRMHVGNLRTALYAFLIAKHEDGEFLLRIEDTDQERYVEGAVEIIYRTLEETGLIHDEGPDKDGGVGPYVQSERQASGIYLEYAKLLVEKGEAYYCFCTQERLDSLKQTVEGQEIMTYDKHCLSLSREEVEANLAAGMPYVIRQNNPTEGTTTFHDEIYGDITVDNSELDDMVLIKSDGYPTYNFANVVDDHLMGITHVVRGNEYLSSSPKYNRLYAAFGWDVPVYVHCPLITNEEHKKLSKRSGHASYEDLIEQGFISEAVVNYVALLGWSPVDNREIFSLAELIKEFDYHNIKAILKAERRGISPEGLLLSGGRYDAERMQNEWHQEHRLTASDAARDAAEKAAALLRENELGVQYIKFGMSESDVSYLMADELCMFGSDALYVPGMKVTHPRSIGTFPCVLRRAVRELGAGAVTSAMHPRVLVSALRTADVVIASQTVPPHAFDNDVVEQMKEGVITICLDGYGHPTGTPVFPSMPVLDLAGSHRRIRQSGDAPRVCYVNAAGTVPRTVAMALSNTLGLKLRCTSSKANNTPASGALKAAARPAQAPQVMRYFSSVRLRP